MVVTGTVDDVRPYFERVKVFVNPVRIGGGFRGKILEAMSMGLPIVTTSLGAEGVNAEDGQEMIIADEPADFAAATVRLLRDDGLCESLGARARDLALENFSWEKGVEELEQVSSSQRRLHQTCYQWQSPPGCRLFNRLPQA